MNLMKSGKFFLSAIQIERTEIATCNWQKKKWGKKAFLLSRQREKTKPL